ncbi:hypothetical protein ALNOE001_15620 [Candidatus Methanobinarius endosymbioticus]|uniref:Uncharacterized protein n=1 Tax=Candidatus Methanobinarius endosymbioticus TaxID=2006182 RepID=A0A366MAV4_9EURY|nr:hypothetical protein ALNOE001_15620 [Candidatus Methanobinarius endosymbioticus]
MSGKLIKFYINNQYIGSARTNNNGIAFYNYGINSENIKFVAIFEGDLNYLNSNSTKHYRFNITNNSTNHSTCNETYNNSDIVIAKMKNRGNPISVLFLISMISFIAIFSRKRLKI